MSCGGKLVCLPPAKDGLLLDYSLVLQQIYNTFMILKSLVPLDVLVYKISLKALDWAHTSTFARPTQWSLVRLLLRIGVSHKFCFHYWYFPLHGL